MLARRSRLRRVSQSASWPSILAPGKGRRFSVVDAGSGKRSSTWRVWTGKNVDQVFIMEMATGPVWKVSLHNELSRTTGLPAWRIAMTKEAAQDQSIERAVIDDWIPEVPISGWLEGVGILIPFSHLRAEAEPLHPSVLQVPSSTACSGYAVRLFLEQAGAVGTAFPPGHPVMVMERSNGGRAYVLATPVDLAARQYEAFDAMCDEARAGRSNDVTYPSDRFVGVVRFREQRVLVDLSVS